VTDLDFLEAIAADDGDVVPFLIYADWLEEQGDAKAEFIRLQCQEQEMEADDDGYEELTDRIHEILVEHHDEWTGGIHHILDRFTFQNGLLDYAELDAKAFVQHAEKLFHKGLFRNATLKNSASVINELADCPWLHRLQGLCLDENQLDNNDISRLFSSKRLSNLRRLSLTGNNITCEGVHEISLARLPKLQFLDLSGNRIRNGGVKSLAQSKNTPELEVLWLHENEIRQTGIESLSRSANFPRLREVNLKRNPFIRKTIEFAREWEERSGIAIEVG